MRIKIACAALAMLLCTLTFSQTATHRLRFKYLISANKVSELNGRGFQLLDANGNSITICPNNRTRTLIKNTDGLLTFDPWTISDTRVNTATSERDPCYGSAGVLNAQTPYPLTMNVRRGTGANAIGATVMVGHPTENVRFYYTTFLVGVYSLALKIRPRVKDYLGNEYAHNAIAGTINAGLTIGYSIGFTDFNHRGSTSWSATPTFSPGFSAVALKNEPLKSQVTTTYNTNNFVWSPALGLLVARNDIGIFFAYGKDYMTGKNADAWAYQKKGFWGLGLSASFKL